MLLRLTIGDRIFLLLFFSVIILCIIWMYVFVPVCKMIVCYPQNQTNSHSHFFEESKMAC